VEKGASAERLPRQERVVSGGQEEGVSQEGGACAGRLPRQERVVSGGQEEGVSQEGGACAGRLPRQERVVSGGQEEGVSQEGGACAGRLPSQAQGWEPWPERRSSQPQRNARGSKSSSSGGSSPWDKNVPTPTLSGARGGRRNEGNGSPHLPGSARGEWDRKSHSPRAVSKRRLTTTSRRTHDNHHAGAATVPATPATQSSPAGQRPPVASLAPAPTPKVAPAPTPGAAPAAVAAVRTKHPRRAAWRFDGSGVPPVSVPPLLFGADRFAAEAPPGLRRECAYASRDTSDASPAVADDPPQPGCHVEGVHDMTANHKRQVSTLIHR